MDWKERIHKAKDETDKAKQAKQAASSTLAESLREVLRTVVEPTFREVGEFAREQGVECKWECTYDANVTPPSGRFTFPDGQGLSVELNIGETVVHLKYLFIDGGKLFGGSIGEFKTPEEIKQKVTVDRLQTKLASLIEDHLARQRRS